MAKICPECDNPLDIDEDEVEEGDTITCDECGTELEVVTVDPLELTPVDAEGYDDEDLSRDSDEDDEDAWRVFVAPPGGFSSMKNPVIRID